MPVVAPWRKAGLVICSRSSCGFWAPLSQSTASLNWQSFFVRTRQTLDARNSGARPASIQLSAFCFFHSPFLDSARHWTPLQRNCPNAAVRMKNTRCPRLIADANVFNRQNAPNSAALKKTGNARHKQEIPQRGFCSEISTMNMAKRRRITILRPNGGSGPQKRGTRRRKENLP